MLIDLSINGIDKITTNSKTEYEKIKNNLTKTDTIKVEYLNKNDLIEEYGLIGQLEKIEIEKFGLTVVDL